MRSGAGSVGAHRLLLVDGGGCSDAVLSGLNAVGGCVCNLRYNSVEPIVAALDLVPFGAAERVGGGTALQALVAAFAVCWHPVVSVAGVLEYGVLRCGVPPFCSEFQGLCKVSGASSDRRLSHECKGLVKEDVVVLSWT